MTARTWSTCWAAASARSAPGGAAPEGGRPGPGRRSRRQEGATLIEAAVAVGLTALLVLAFFQLFSLAQWGQADTHARFAAAVVARREVEWLQAYCANRLAQVVQSTYDPARPRSCTNYPRDVDLRDDSLGVPGLTYRIQVQPAESGPGETNYDAVQVTVTVRWPRAFVMSRPGTARFTAWVWGNSQEYWEDWTEWQGS